jgi:DNA-binding transcriptional ArsR family regulator
MPSFKMTGGRVICVVMLCTLLASSLATAQIPSQSLQSKDTKIEYQSCKAVKVSGDSYLRVVLHFRSGSQSFYGPYSGSNRFQGKGKYGGKEIVSVSVNTFGSTISKDNPLSCKSDPTTTTTTTSAPTTTTTTSTPTTTTTTSAPTTTTSTTVTTTTSSPSTTSQSSTTQNTGSGGSSTTAVSTSEEPGSTDKTTDGGETTQPAQSPTDSTTSLSTTEENNSTGNFPQSQGDAGSSENETGSFSSILLALLAVGGLLLVGLVGTIAGWKYRDKIFKGIPGAMNVGGQSDSLTRMDIFEFVTQNPGTNIASITEDLGVNQSTVQQHLRTLTKDGYLHTQSLQGSNRYFVAGKDGQYDRSVAAALRNEELRELIDTLHQHGPLSGSKLSELTEKDRSTISRQLDDLEESGVITRVQDGNQVRNELNIDLPTNE